MVAMLFIIRPNVMSRLAVCHLDHRTQKFIAVFKVYSCTQADILGKFTENCILYLIK